MKKTSVGVLVLLMAMGLSVCYGQDEGFTIDNEFSTKYMWRGFDVFDDHGAWMPSVDFDLGEGWGFNVWGAQPFGSGSEELKELDYTLSFSNTVNEGEMDEMEYSVGWIYYDFPEANSDADAQEIGLGLSWPSALSGGDLPLVPSVYVSSFMPETGDDGVYVNLRVDWEVVCPDIDQVLNMYSDISYNDSIGFDGNGNQVGSDLTHISFGVSTDVEVMDLTITPFVNYQVSMDDSVNDDNEVWGGFSTSITF